MNKSVTQGRGYVDFCVSKFLYLRSSKRNNRTEGEPWVEVGATTQDNK